MCSISKEWLLNSNELFCAIFNEQWQFALGDYCILLLSPTIKSDQSMLFLCILYLPEWTSFQHFEHLGLCLSCVLNSTNLSPISPVKRVQIEKLHLSFSFWTLFQLKSADNVFHGPLSHFMSIIRNVMISKDFFAAVGFQWTLTVHILLPFIFMVYTGSSSSFERGWQAVQKRKTPTLLDKCEVGFQVSTIENPQVSYCTFQGHCCRILHGSFWQRPSSIGLNQFPGWFWIEDCATHSAKLMKPLHCTIKVKL